jgi:hypothetical protein
VLKQLALMIPSLRNLHDERNRYAAEFKRKWEENNQLRESIEQLKKCCENQRDADQDKVLREIANSIASIEKKFELAALGSTQTESFNPVDRNALADRGLFVVGHARSGTSILTDALNSSPDICCIGEANFHVHVEKEDFCSWFNSKRQNNGNPPMRSTCIPSHQGTGWQFLLDLSQTFRYVGEKVAFRQESKGFDVSSFFRFSVRHFMNSNYVCVIRDPYRVAGSTIAMFENCSIEDSIIESIETSQLQTYYLIASLIATLPRVFLLVHEDIDANAFQVLGDFLEVDLSKAADDYDQEIIVVKQEISAQLRNGSSMLTAASYFQRLRNGLDRGTLRPKILNELRVILLDLHAELLRRNALPKM